MLLVKDNTRHSCSYSLFEIATSCTDQEESSVNLFLERLSRLFHIAINDFPDHCQS